jgi:CelD/BcsL family acetyltransferase involved in cellulose biosynthesis
MRRVEVHQGSEFFSGLRTSWQELVGDSPTATPFQTWEWQSTWYRHYGGGRRMLAVSVWEGQDLIGLMPFTRSRGPWRVLRPSGIGPSDYLHPLARRRAEEDVAYTIQQVIRELPNVDLIDWHQVRETQPAANLNRETPIDQAMCLVLDLPKTFDQYLAMLGKSLRYDIRKLEKTMFTSGRATIEIADESTLPVSLEAFFELHHKRWRKRGMPGAFLGRAKKFHADWALQAVRNSWLRLGVLRNGGSVIGAIYAMTLGETTYYYQAGFDPAHAAVSPGTLVVANAIRQSIDEGVTRFDFMRGDEPYKRRWKPQNAYANQRLLIPLNSSLGRVGESWNRAGWKVESRIRQRLEGKGLI